MPKPSSATPRPARVSQLGKRINALQNRAAQLAADKALLSFLRPPRLLPNAHQRAFLDNAESSSLKVDGLTIRTYTWPTGKPNATTILIAHGYSLCAGSMVWLAQPLVEAGFKVVTWDQMAHGESEGSWGDARIFQHTIQILARQHAPLAAIVGQSIAGSVAIMTLVEDPSIVCPLLVCLSSPTQMDTPLGTFLRFNGCSLDLLPRIRATVEKRNVLVPTKLRGILPNHNIKTQLLIVQDEDDEVTTMADAEYLARFFKDSRVETTKGLRHFGIIEDGKVAQLVTEFIIHGSGSPQAKL